MTDRPTKQPKKQLHYSFNNVHLSPCIFQDHIKSVHEGIRFSCEQCDYKATSRANLKKHVQGRHAARTLPCDYCDEYVGKPTWPRLLDIYGWKAHHQGALLHYILMRPTNNFQRISSLFFVSSWHVALSVCSLRKTIWP